MNNAEQEQDTNTKETVAPREAGETSKDDQSRELEGLFDNYRKEKLRTIDAKTTGAMRNLDERLKSANSIGYPPEEIQRMMQEQGVTGKLEQNQQNIEALGKNTKRQIENASSQNTSETPSLIRPEQTEIGGERERIKEL